MVTSPIISYEPPLLKLWRDTHMCVHTALRNVKSFPTWQIVPSSIWKTLSALRPTTCHHHHRAAVFRVTDFPQSDVLLGTCIPLNNGFVITLKQNPTLSVWKIWHIIQPCLFQLNKRDEQVPTDNCTSRCQQGNVLRLKPSAERSHLNG